MYKEDKDYPASLSYTTDYAYPAAKWNCNDQTHSFEKSDANKHSRTAFWIVSAPRHVLSMMFLKHLLSFENLVLPLWFLLLKQTSIVQCLQDMLVVKYLDTHLCKEQTLVYPLSPAVVVYTVYYLRLSSFEYEMFESRFGRWNRLWAWAFVTKPPNHSMFLHATQSLTIFWKTRLTPLDHSFNFYSILRFTCNFTMSIRHSKYLVA